VKAVSFKLVSSIMSRQMVAVGGVGTEEEKESLLGGWASVILLFIKNRVDELIWKSEIMRADLSPRRRGGR